MYDKLITALISEFREDIRIEGIDVPNGLREPNCKIEPQVSSENSIGGLTWVKTVCGFDQIAGPMSSRHPILHSFVQ